MFFAGLLASPSVFLFSGVFSKSLCAHPTVSLFFSFFQVQGTPRIHTTCSPMKLCVTLVGTIDPLSMSFSQRLIVMNGDPFGREDKQEFVAASG